MSEPTTSRPATAETKCRSFLPAFDSTFSGPIIQFVHHEVNFFLPNGCEESVLGEILANETIGFFIEAAFPPLPP
jgi:hypothetical protein